MRQDLVDHEPILNTVVRLSAMIGDAQSRLDRDLLLDERDNRLGVMFSEMELIGIPMRVVVNDKGLKKGVVEFKGRTNESNADVLADNIT